jgi:predicted dehydrogenase
VDGWRARGEGSRWWSLAALGTHALDLALWFGRRGPEGASRVEAVIDREGPVDRRAEVCLGFDDGLTLHVAVSVEYRSVPRLSIVGDLGELEALGTLGARGEGTLVHRLPRGATELLPFQPVDPYEAQLRAVRAAVEGAKEPSASGSVGARQVRLLERLTAR